MGLPGRIANAGMTSSENPRTLAGHTGRIQLDVHQLVHVAENQHIAVQLHDALILGQRERGEFAPAVIEADVIREFLRDRREKVGNVAFRDASCVEDCMAMRRE